ncbi:hypothetical protein GQ42DRAFT_161024 [Ramicandelaber brevisporus]|nr:hypothetical protein GQ42DRAFT_161024 [Ramicandelaber brevisporus]
MRFFASITALVSAAAGFGALMAGSVGAQSPKVVVGYYPSWKNQYLTNFDFSKVTNVQLAFGIVQADGSFSYEGDWQNQGVISRAHAANAKVTLSIGGWTGSYAFSPLVASPNARANFISNVVTYIKNNNLDGVDLDWEYPGRQGNTCNKVDQANDTPNFLLLLKELRAGLDTSFGTGATRKIVTLAVRVQPFDVNGSPSSNVSAFAQYVDFASVMAFDINGGWSSTTGPNAPLNYEAGKADPFSVVQAVTQWLNAGWPADKLVLGTGFYGRSVTTTQDMTQNPTNQYQGKTSTVPKGDQEDAPWADTCAGGGAVYSGVWYWRNLRSQGVLTTPNTAGAGWNRYWDPITKTPWLFNKAQNIYISYDDVDSLGAKVDYAISQNLRGMMVWELHGDNGELLPVLNRVRGNQPPTSSTTPPSSSTTPPSSSTTPPSSSTTPPSSSSTPPVTTTPPGNCPANAYQCDNNGKAAGYKVCVNGSWLGQSCAPGTVCRQSGSSIYCDWP